MFSINGTQRKHSTMVAKLIMTLDSLDCRVGHRFNADHEEAAAGDSRVKPLLIKGG